MENHVKLAVREGQGLGHIAAHNLDGIALSVPPPSARFQLLFE